MDSRCRILVSALAAVALACGGGSGIGGPFGQANPPSGNATSQCLTLLAQSLVEDASGQLTTILDYEYDAQGALESIEEFDLAAGVVARVTYVRDATQRDVDEGADGTIDRSLTRELDSDGRLLTETVDEGANGSADRITRFVYDANGKLIRTDIDANADGATDTVRILLYAPNDVLITELVDLGADGTVDDTVDLVYGADGNLAQRRFDAGDDGIADEIRSFLYNADGDLVSETLDADGDGVIDSVTTNYFVTRCP